VHQTDVEVLGDKNLLSMAQYWHRDIRVTQCVRYCFISPWIRPVNFVYEAGYRNMSTPREKLEDPE
jgi:hypothetical protein